MKDYVEMFRDKVCRTGDHLKTPRFCQILCVCDHIQTPGCTMDDDGSIGENVGELKIRDNAKLTNK